MRIAVIFDKTRPDTTGGYIERACREAGHACDHWWLRDAAAIPAAYDLYLRVDHGDDYLAVWPRHLRPVVFYAIDTHLAPSWKKIRRAAARYDAVCCAQARAAAALPNGQWLPLGCDPGLHTAPLAERTLDIAFVGTEGGVPRKFYLQALRERYPNSAIGPADHRQMAVLYGRARIGFNYAIADDVNMRVFEVLAAGTLLVTNALSGDAFGRLGLRDRQELVLYRSPRELIEAIDYFLVHAEERERIASAGQNAALAFHTYRHRVVQLMESLGLQAGARETAAAEAS